MPNDNNQPAPHRERDELIKFILSQAKRSLHQDRRPAGYFDEILRKISLIKSSSEPNRR
jgi:hypothetical protein